MCSHHTGKIRHNWIGLSVNLIKVLIFYVQWRTHTVMKPFQKARFKKTNVGSASFVSVPVQSTNSKDSLQSHSGHSCYREDIQIGFRTSGCHSSCTEVLHGQGQVIFLALFLSVHIDLHREHCCNNQHSQIYLFRRIEKDMCHCFIIKTHTTLRS